jgi:lipopolysaccharide export system protein LptA
LSGKVHVQRVAEQSMQGDAGRAVLDFSGQNELQKVHASEGVRLVQHVLNPGGAANAESQQNYDITAAAIDFFIKQGRRLDRAETSGAARITIVPAHPPTSGTARNAAQRTVITAGKFDARFTATQAGSRLASIHGAPDAKIVSSAPDLPDRVSTSRTLDAAFLPEGGISSIVQQGSVVFTDNQSTDKRTQAWADKALYTPIDGILLLSGNPRVADGGMVTTANTIRFNRKNNDAFAEGDVKSTYSDLKEQPDGALLASASPIHVTAATMAAHSSTAVALYQGKARLWQDANVIEAPSIQFDRNHRSLIAEGTAAQSVSTVLVQAEPSPEKNKGSDQTAKGRTKDHAADAITVTSARLGYVDAERRAHYDGGVIAKGASFTAAAKTADAYLLPRSQAANNQQLAAPGRLDHMVAEGSVIVQQPARRAEGEKLVYTAADDKFVLTGGPPSIFDAERGKITGVSLTFFRADDRVLVEGKASTPVVTQTRVAK